MSISVNRGSPGPVKSVFIRLSDQRGIVQVFVRSESSLTVAVHTEERGARAEVSRVILTPVLVQRTGQALGGRMSTLAYRNPKNTRNMFLL